MVMFFSFTSEGPISNKKTLYSKNSSYYFNNSVNIMELKKRINENEASEFIFALAMRESGYLYNNKPPDFTITNRFGYRGAFQFGYAALKETKYEYVWLSRFRANPNIWPREDQYDAVIKLLKVNNRYLGDEVNKFIGDTLQGVRITKSGILASAHLLGSSRVKRYLYSGGYYNPRDGFKTSLTEYMRLFEGYDFDLMKLDSSFKGDLNYHDSLALCVKNGEWDYRNSIY